MRTKKTHRISILEYKTVYDNYYTPLCLFSNKFLNDIDASKDVVQDIFIKIWDQKINLDEEINIKSYLYTSVRNKCLDYLKSSEYQLKHKLTEEDIKTLESQSYFEKEVLLEEVTRIVEDALNTLPAKCKQIVYLSMKGYRNVQISEELSISINTVKTQKRIAYQKLRPLLKGYYIFIAHLFLS